MKKLVIIAGVCLLLSIIAIIASVAIKNNKVEEPTVKNVSIAAWDIVVSIKGVGLEDIEAAEPKTIGSVEVANLTSDKIESILSQNLPNDETTHIAGVLVRTEDKDALMKFSAFQKQDNGIVAAPDGFFYTVHLTPLITRAVTSETFPISAEEKQQLSQIADSLKMFKDNSSIEMISGN